MVTKKARKSSKKVKTLRTKSLSAKQAKGVRGGATFGIKAQDKPGTLTDRASVKYN